MFVMCAFTAGVWFPLAPYVSYSGAHPVVVALLGLMGSLLALSLALLLVGWFVKSRRRHSQKLLTAYNRSSWLRQCYSRIGNDDWSSQIQNVNNTANAPPNRQYYSAVSEDSPVNLKSKNYTLNKYNSYEDHLNDNLTSRYYSRNTDHRRKQRASEHQEVKCHKAEKSLIDDGFIFTHNADSESVKMSIPRNSVSNSLTDWDSSSETSGYQQMECTNYVVENYQQRNNNNNDDNNSQCQYYGNTQVEFLSSDV
ncbi:unnamed protein product [Schistosoma curassoni]|nr:unnamed protein product [Schistosoma curassoni]